MANIQVDQFQGIAPRLDPRLLGERQGQVAENLKLTSLALQSWRRSVLEFTPALASPALQTIFRYKGYGADRWLTWTTDVDVVPAPISNDTTSRIYFTGAGGKPQMADNAAVGKTAIDAGGGGPFPENSVTLGMPAPTTAPAVAIGGGGAGTDPQDKLYVYTFVSAFGEESAPSPVSTIISVDHNTGGEVDLSGLEVSIPAEYNDLALIRIYRSNVGTNQAAYQFVDEISPSATYSDTTIDALLGEVIVSSEFDLPPDDMFGLLDFGNGILVGFTEFEILFCEPFQPHAWPISYRLAVADTIIGGGVFGNTVVVCTKDQPVLIIGNHPSTMTQTVHPDHQACVSKEGIVQFKNRVVYPSPDGLYEIGYGGGRLLTEPLYDRETWQLRFPAQLRSTNWDTRYIGFTDLAGLVIETANNVVSASDFNIDVDAIYNDPENDQLFISQVNDAGVNEILEFNAGGKRLPYMWKSKKFSSGNLSTITCGKILAQYGDLLTAPELLALAQERADLQAANTLLLGTDLQDAVNSHEVNANRLDGVELTVNGSLLQTLPEVPETQNVVIKLFGDGAQVGVATSVSDQPFRFPSGGRYRQYEIEIETFTDVNQITLASSVQDLISP